jgi:N-acetyl-anhydromuramyl-L-alanine amidase AmpD
MRAKKIPDIEAGFRKTLTAAGKKFKQVPAVFPYAVGLQAPKQTHFIDKKLKKTKVVLHFTCGVLTGDIFTLTESTVSTAFVLARDGTAYQLFNPELSAHHLGVGQGYKNSEASFSSVAIEISNLGPLKLKGNTLVDIYGSDYCTLADVALYDKVSYRGYEYYCSYTDAQYETLARLVPDICDRFTIPKTLLPEGKLYETDPAATQGKRIGVVAHVNFRKDKCDLAPNFKWEKIIQ